LPHRDESDCLDTQTFVAQVFGNAQGFTSARVQLTQTMRVKVDLG
jgi:hypothetical protein